MKCEELSVLKTSEELSVLKTMQVVMRIACTALVKQLKQLVVREALGTAD